MGEWTYNQISAESGKALLSNAHHDGNSKRDAEKLSQIHEEKAPDLGSLGQKFYVPFTMFPIWAFSASARIC